MVDQIIFFIKNRATTENVFNTILPCKIVIIYGKEE